MSYCANKVTQPVSQTKPFTPTWLSPVLCGYIAVL